MQVMGLITPLIKPGDDLVGVVLGAANRKGGLKDGDVLVIASSAVSTAQERLRKLADVKVSKRAKKLAKESGLNEKFVEVVIQEADRVLGAGDGCVLTLKDGMLRTNAGIDASNAPRGHVVLMPDDADRAAEEILNEVKRRTKKRVGVILADSHIQPLRLGTVGQAIGVAGIDPVIDCRKQRDLYGRRLQVTFRAVADQLASAAQVVMGEADERVPAVIVRDVRVNFSKSGRSPKIEPERDIYAGLLGIKE
jgi:coenzyme F420-0:L-glutamate ligase/coenzyme F420-1:gamma-L-glutamate ligase